MQLEDISQDDLFNVNRSRQGNEERSRAHIETMRASAQETQYYPSISIAFLRHTSEDLQFTVIIPFFSGLFNARSVASPFP